MSSAQAFSKTIITYVNSRAKVHPAFELLKKIFGLEHEETLLCMSKLAQTYDEQGRWDDAEKLQEQTLETVLKITDVEDLFTMLTMSASACIYSNRGRWDEADEC